MDIVSKTERFVQEYMRQFDCSHDWHHVERVVRQALVIAKAESANTSVDILVVHLAALLHDVNDAKYTKESTVSIAEFLTSNGLEEAKARLVSRIVDNVSFRKELKADGKSEWKDGCMELACVQDADRLDAVGAFGILRCAAFSGARNRPLHDPQDAISADITFEDYVNDSKKGSAIAHFHGKYSQNEHVWSDAHKAKLFYIEKLLKLCSMMKTKTGKQEAQHRHDFMVQFLAQVDSEYAFGNINKV